jgi:hypothetical protein
MSFFIKYKIHINIVFLLFWIYLIYDVLSSEGFIIKKLAVPILFIILSVFNIFEALKNKKSKSEE